VLRWRDDRRRRGAAVYVVRYSPGRPPKLRVAEKRKLEKLLLRGAVACGYRTNLWTTQRIATLIEQRFGVRYHRDHIGRILAALGWSHQKPTRRALERDDARIAAWKDQEWPAIKKTPRGWAPTLSS